MGAAACGGYVAGAGIDGGFVDGVGGSFDAEADQVGSERRILDEDSGEGSIFDWRTLL